MLEPGDQIDIWVVEQALGQGGMGSVYRCHNKNAQRIKAAIKVLDPSLSRPPQRPSTPPDADAYDNLNDGFLDWNEEPAADSSPEAS